MMREPAGMNQTSRERRLFPPAAPSESPGPFDLKAFNLRPAPSVKVTGFGDTPEGMIVFLSCGHSLPPELADDLPVKGNSVSCWQCRDNPPIKADGAIRRGI